MYVFTYFSGNKIEIAQQWHNQRITHGDEEHARAEELTCNETENSENYVLINVKVSK